MKRRKLLALALALTTAVTTLAPNTGFLPTMVVRAAASQHKVAYVSESGKGVFTDDFTSKLGARDEVSSGMTDGGGTFKLPAAPEDKNHKYTFLGWEVTLNGGSANTMAAGSTVEYADADYEAAAGLEITAKWDFGCSGYVVYDDGDGTFEADVTSAALKPTGGSFTLAAAPTDSTSGSEKYKFKDWLVSVGGETKVCSAGESVTYDKYDYQQGIIVTAEWRKIVKIVAADLDPKTGGKIKTWIDQGGDKAKIFEKTFDNSSDWSAVIEWASEASGNALVALTGNYEGSAASDAAKVKITGAKVVKKDPLSGAAAGKVAVR